MKKIQPEDLAALPHKMAVKKPIAIKVYEMHEPFEVQTMEGAVRGKAGDFIIVGVRGEMYPIDRAIFFETYAWEE